MRQAQGRFSRHLPCALASGARGLQPGVTARCFSVRVGVGNRASGARSRQPGVTARYPSARVGVVKRVARGEVSLVQVGVCECVRGREARRGLQPGDVRSFFRRAPVGEGARRRARARRRTICSPARCSACRRGRRRGGLHVHNPAPWRCVPRFVSAWGKGSVA